MLQDIKTMEDVKTFLEQLAHEIDDFHPLQDFKNYVQPNSHMRRYTDEEADIRNALLDKCFPTCEYYANNTIEYIEWFYDLQRLCIEHEQA